MKSIVTCILVLVSASLFAQAETLDPGFGTGGIYKRTDPLPNGLADAIYAAKVLSNGKILLAGAGNTFVSNGYRDFSLIQLNANGTLDSSFGTSGKLYIDFSVAADYVGSDDAVRSVAVQTDGKIVIAGTVATPANAVDSNGQYNRYNIGIARVLPNGKIDSGFGGTGKLRINLSNFIKAKYNENYCYGAVVRNNGKIVLGGYTNTLSTNFIIDYDALQIQLNSNGSFDNTFGKNGVITYPQAGTNEIITSVAQQTDGKVLMAGQVVNIASSSINKTVIIRTLTSGKLDKTYNGTGYNITNTDNQRDNRVAGLALQADGKSVIGVASFGRNSAASKAYLLRYNTNGKLDATFGSGGKVTVDSSATISASSVSVDGDGKIIETTLDFNVYRRNPNGSPDNSFGTNGKATLNIEGSCYASTVQPDKKIIIAGSIFYSLGRLGGGQTEVAARILGTGSALIATDRKADAVGAVAFNQPSVVVFPNPAKDHFAVRLASGGQNIPASIRVTDISGKTLDIITGVKAGDLIIFGSRYPAGTYMVEVIQGENCKTVTVIKQ